MWILSKNNTISGCGNTRSIADDTIGGCGDTRSIADDTGGGCGNTRSIADNTIGGCGNTRSTVDNTIGNYVAFAKLDTSNRFRITSMKFLPYLVSCGLTFTQTRY